MNRNVSIETPETRADDLFLPSGTQSGALPELGPARQVNLRELVYDQLKNAFMSGYFTPATISTCATWPIASRPV